MTPNYCERIFSRFGIIFHGVRDEQMDVTFSGRLKRYKIKHVLDFDPTRKRMSVILEDPSGKLLLLTKGADTAILNYCAKGNIHEVEEHIVDYARVSLFIF